MTTHAADANTLSVPTNAVDRVLLFNICVWALLLLSALLFVQHFGRNVPFWDEWNIITFLTGQRQVDLAWLWSEHNGHRIPFPRLILLGLYKISGNDFRAGMYFNVAACAALALALLLLGEKTGFARLTDIVFPLLLLSWGHYENLLWSWQVTQVVPVILAGWLLVLMARDGIDLRFRAALVAGVCVLLLPLSGVPGLAYAPAMIVWLSVVSYKLWRSIGYSSRYKAIGTFSFVMACIVLLALYLAQYQEPNRHLQDLQWRSSIKAAMQFLAGGFGPAGKMFWPWSGYITFALLLSTGAMLVGTAITARADERSRAIALLCFLTGAFCLAGSIGIGRRDWAFSPRYYLMAAPTICCIYLAWALVPPARWRAPGRYCIFVLAAAAFIFNFRDSIVYARDYRNRMTAFQNDLLAGQAPSALLARHVADLCSCPFGGESTWGNGPPRTARRVSHSTFPVMNCISFHDWLGECMDHLARKRIGIFAHLKSEPAYVEIPLNENGMLSAQNPTFHVAPRFIAGIRITWKPNVKASDRPECLQVFWKSPGSESDKNTQRYIHYLSPGEDSETIWVDGVVERIAINVDNKPDLLRRFDVSLLVVPEKSM